MRKITTLLIVLSVFIMMPSGALADGSVQGGAQDVLVWNNTDTLSWNNGDTLSFEWYFETPEGSSATYNDECGFKLQDAILETQLCDVAWIETNNPPVPGNSGWNTYTATLSGIMNLKAFEIYGKNEGDGMVNSTLTVKNVQIIPAANAIITIDDVVVNETSGTAEFTVSVDKDPVSDVTVVCTTADGSAQAGGDYTAKTQTLTFVSGSGTLAQTFSVTINNETLVESSENFYVNLSGATGPGSISDSQGECTINDNDSATVSIASTTQGNEAGPVDGVFTVTQTAESSSDTVLNYSVGGTATSGSDYTALSGSVTISAGDTTATITVPVTDDALVEEAETVVVTLTSITSSDPQISIDGANDDDSLDITDNDTATFTINDQSVDEAAGTMTFTVSLDNPLDTAVAVDVSYADVSATGGTDYDVAADQVTFPSGNTADKTVTVAITDDNIVELSETFTASLSTATPLGTRTTDFSDTGTGTITDNDSATVSIAATTQGNEAGPVDGLFTVTQTAVSSTATVLTLTPTGVAVNGTDYTALAATVTIAAGSTSNTITIDVNDDAIVEATEDVILTIAKSSGDNEVTVPGAGNNATINITDNDSATVSIAATTQGNEAGPLDGVFTVTQTAESSTDTVLDYSGGGTATSGSDYTALSGSVTISAGDTTATITVPVTDDAIVEETETVVVTLTSITSSDPQISIDGANDDDSLDITDNDAATVSIAATTQGNEAGPLDGVFTVTQTAESSTDTVLTITPTGAAINGTDYTALAATVTIAAGSTSNTVTIDVNDDAIVEATEDVILTIAKSSGDNEVTVPGAGNNATINITDNDSATVSIAATTQGNEAGPVDGVFTVTQTAESSTDTVLTITPTGVAINGTDYTALAATVTIAAGSTSNTVTIDVNDDAIVEATEDVILTIAKSSGDNEVTVPGAGNNATINITDNDSATVSIAATTQGNEAGPVDGVFTVTQTAESSTDTVLTLTPTGAAINGTDYTALAATVTIAAGSTSNTITIDVNDDAIVEATEDVILTIAKSSGDNEVTVPGAGNNATINITDNDSLTVQFDGATANDDEASGGNLPKLLVTGQVETGHSVAIDLTRAGTATGGGTDYVNPTTLTVNAGTYAAQAFAIPGLAIQDDTIVEPDETIILTIDATPDDVTAGAQDTHTYTINDDDTLSVKFDGATANDDEASGGNLPELLVTGEVAMGHSVAIDLTRAGTATGGGTDYDNPTTLTVNPGTYAASAFAIPGLSIKDDTIVEPDETIILTIDATPDDVTAGAPNTHTYTINDDDTLSVEFDGATANDDEATGGNLPELLVTGQVGVGHSVAIDLTRAGTATGGGTDYVNPTTLTVNAGTYAASAFAIPGLAIKDDTIVEPDETIILTIDATPDDVDAGAQDTHTYTINDDDMFGFISIDSPSVDEGTDVTFTITLNADRSLPVDITYTTADGTATLADNDYTQHVDTVVTIPAGNAGQTATFAVATGNDRIIEPDETFTVTVSSTDPVFSGVDVTGTGTILNNDVSLTIAEAGSGLAVSTVTAGSGSITGFSGGTAPGTYTYQIGETVTLTATDTMPAAAGSEFQNWTILAGDPTGAGWDPNAETTTVKMNDNIRITGNFIGTWSITPTARTGGTITPSTVQTGYYGTDQTFTIAASTGYCIADVTVDGTSQGPLETYTFQDIYGDHTIVAVFAEGDTPYQPVQAGDEQIYTAGVPPIVLMVMGRNHKLYYEAYNDASDLDGDGTLDIRYNPAIDYYGYFDSYKVYTYDTTDERFEPVRTTADKKTSGVPGDNEWSGDFLNYMTMTRMDTLRKVLYGGYRSTDTATETVLQRVYVPQDAHSWGKEYKDEATDGYHISNYAPLALPAAQTRHLFASTTLEDTSTHQGQLNRPLLRVLPNNSNRIWAWVAKERPVCDDSLEVSAGAGGNHPGHPGNHSDYNNLVATYAVPANLYGTGAPANGRIDGQGNPYGADYSPYNQNADEQENYLTIFAGNLNITTAGDYYFAVDGDDAVEVLIDGNLIVGWYGGHGRCNCTSYASGPVYLAAGAHTVEFRHEEAWGGDNYYLRWRGPDSGGSWQIVPTASYSGLTQTTYLLETSALPASQITDYVVKVVVADSSMPEPNCKQYPNGNYKPTGILQKYGEPGRMYFGLMTGSYAKNTDGGVLRKRIGPITDEIDSSTGQFLVPADGGIIDTINKFRTINFNYTGTGSNYAYVASCGWVATRPINPGECRMWGNPVAEMMYEGLRYFAGKGTPTVAFDYSGVTDDATLGLPKPSWDDPYTTHDYCAKPFMLVLSDIYPTYDSDDLPGSYFNPGFTDTLGTLDVEDIADMILTEEGDAGNHYIGRLGSTYDGSCFPKNLNGFGDVRGLCPEEPTKQGSYYAASVAYYGRTQDINSVEGEQNVLSYMVALASALPRIEIPVGGQVVTLIPFAKSIGGYGISSAQGQYQPTNTIVDFFVESITPTSGIFRINYEDVEQGADHDQDAIASYQYQVIDDAGNPVTQSADGTRVKISVEDISASGSIIQHLGYIISGTTADGTYLEVRDQDTAAGSDPDYFLDTPPGFGPGENPNDGVALPLTTVRIFNIGTTTAATLLKDPLWYAAKWGGFNELDEDDPAKPDLDSEWDEDVDGVPDTYFYVVNPLKLEQQLNQSFSDILSRGVSHVAPVVSVDEANRTQSGDKLYMAFFKPMPDGYWQGNLKKYGLDYLTRTDCSRTTPEWTVVDKNSTIAGDCDGAFKPSSISYWSASADGGYVDRGGVGGLLKDSMPGSDPKIVPSTGPYYDFRNIYTYPVGATDGVLVRFNHANISKENLEVDTDTIRNNIINYIYGYTYDSETNGDPVAKREWILGDIIHSEPRVIDYFNTDGSLYARYIAIGSNDGMLHVFTDQQITIGGTTYAAGDEVFAFVPRDQLKRLQLFSTPDVHQFMVDGASNIFKALTKTGDYYDKTLVFGERRGGRSYWALDVTNPDPSTWTAKWHIEGGSLGTTGFNELGYTWNKPFFAKIRTDTTTVYNIAIFAGGYDPLEDGFPEAFDDADEDGIWDFTDANGNGFYDVGEVSEAHAVTIGGTEFYDRYNPGMNSMGRGIFVVDLDYDPTDGDHNQLILFKATYSDDDADEDEGEDVTTGLDQKYCMMKYSFPANMSVIPFSDTYLLAYAADVYGQIWRIEYDFYATPSKAYDAADSNKWTVKRIFKSNPGSDQASGNVDDWNAGPSLDATDTGRKAFYSPDISYYGNAWTSYPVLYFGTGDRAHPRLRMISNRFYALADHDAADGEVLDETDLFNLTCDELDDNADANGDGTVDNDDGTIQTNIRAIMQLQNPCRGFYRVMDKQGDGYCIDAATDDDHTGEQVLSIPTLFFKTVYFTSYQAVFDDPCNPLGNAYIYALDYSWGTARFDYEGDGANQTLSDTFQMISGSSIPSGVRVITREGHAAGLISAGGAVAGAGESFSTSIPGPPGGVSRMLWETD